MGRQDPMPVASATGFDLPYSPESPGRIGQNAEGNWFMTCWTIVDLAVPIGTLTSRVKDKHRWARPTGRRFFPCLPALGIQTAISEAIDNHLRLRVSSVRLNKGQKGTMQHNGKRGLRGCMIMQSAARPWRIGLHCCHHQTPCTPNEPGEMGKILVSISASIRVPNLLEIMQPSEEH
jgi:hypothetical protein